MAREKRRNPGYLLHRPTGQARVRLRIHGRLRDVYLGPHGSPTSWEKYHWLLAEQFQECGSCGSAVDAIVNREPGVTIAELALQYDDFFSEYYVKDGEITNGRFRAVVGPLVTLYGSTLAAEFGPSKLRAVREHIIIRGHAGQAEYDENGNLLESGEPLSRKYVNALIRDLLRMFKWGVSRELLPVAVHESLATVESIRKGKDNRLQEAKPVRPVPDEHFWSVVNAVAPQIATMLQVQRLAGMRPDEVTIMRPHDIERPGDLWVYRPESHKLDWRDMEKKILLGPKSQSLLEPWLDEREFDAYLFSPKEVAEAILAKRKKRDTSKRRKRRRRRPPGRPKNLQTDWHSVLVARSAAAQCRDRGPASIRC